MANMPYRPQGRFSGELPPLQSIYTPLPVHEFRMLQIIGYDRYGIMRCSIVRAEFNEDTTYPYTAISYTWNEAEKIWYGDYDTSPKPVRLNGIAVLVPDKVANIICLAHQHGRTLIWIDQICINQSDLTEKSHQVARMGKIYRCATEVFTMQGSPNRDTDEVIDLANSHAHTPIHKFKSALMAASLNFTDNKYWRRAWVFQEIALARTVIICCGSRITTFEAISKLDRSIDNSFDANEGLRDALRFLRLLRHYKPILSRVWKHSAGEDFHSSEFAMKGVHSPFLEVLRQSSRHRECQDPRDMLYSRMALASDANTLIPYPDYQMPVEELYKRFATNYIVLKGALDIITFACDTEMQLPNWVPDWTSLDFAWDLGSALSTFKDSLALLTWTEIALPRISRDRSELMVQGRVLKTIWKPDFEGIYSSALMRLTRFPTPYNLSEMPRLGDEICVLRGCPLLVYLRPVGGHFIIVGRHELGQEKLLSPKLNLITHTEPQDDSTKKTWSLSSLDDVQSRPEQVFRIR